MSQQIVLASNANNIECPNNTRSSFTNILPQIINQTNKSYEVRLSAIYIHLRYSYLPSKLASNEPAIILVGKQDARTEYYINIYAQDLEYVSSWEDIVIILNNHLTGKGLARADTNVNTNKASVILSEHTFLLLPSVVKWLSILHNNTKRFIEGIEYINTGTSINFDGRNHIFKHSINPKRVDISLNEISPYKSSGGYSKVIGSFAPRKRHDLFHQEYKNTPFFPISPTFCEQFTIKLATDKKKPLLLTAGQPTIIILEMREKTDDNFVISLASDDNAIKYSSNTSADFRVELPEPLSLDNEWEVALSSAEIPAKINLAKYIQEAGPYITFKDEKHILDIQTLYDEKDLLRNLSDITSSALKTVVTQENFRAEFKLSDTTVELSLNSDFPSDSNEIILSHELTYLFNLNAPKRIALSKGTQTIGEINLNTLRPHIALIETNFSEPILFGDRYQQIVKVMPIGYTHHKHFYEAERLTFVDVMARTFPTLHITIKDVTNTPIIFQDKTQSLLTFIFRKKI